MSISRIFSSRRPINRPFPINSLVCTGSSSCKTNINLLWITILDIWFRRLQVFIFWEVAESTSWSETSLRKSLAIRLAEWFEVSNNRRVVTIITRSSQWSSSWVIRRSLPWQRPWTETWNKWTSKSPFSTVTFKRRFMCDSSMISARTISKFVS